MNLSEDILTKLKGLKSSPVFNLSLSSLELFHSNFIYWMLRQEVLSDKFTIFSDYDPVIAEKGDDFKLIEITREENNLDIVLKFQSQKNKHKKRKKGSYDHILVIENKFKSLPKSEQLEVYSKKKLKAGTVSYILLSFSRPVFFKNQEEWAHKKSKDKVWRFMHYGNLALQLQKRILDTTSNIQNYHRELVRDYKEVIELLHYSFYDMELNGSEVFLFNENDELGKTLRSIRLRDFYVKMQSEKFCYDVYQQLEKDISEAEILKDFGVGLKIKEKGKGEHKITINSGMTQTQAIHDFKYRVSNNLVFGVQIQGKQYRRIIEGPSSRGREVRWVAEELLYSEKTPWFDLSDRVNGDESRLYPKGGKDFNKYGNSFFYRSFYLDGTEKVDQIKKYVMEDMKYLHEHKEELKKLIR